MSLIKAEVYSLTLPLQRGLDQQLKHIANIDCSNTWQQLQYLYKMLRINYYLVLTNTRKYLNQIYNTEYLIYIIVTTDCCDWLIISFFLAFFSQRMKMKIIPLNFRVLLYQLFILAWIMCIYKAVLFSIWDIMCICPFLLLWFYLFL